MNFHTTVSENGTIKIPESVLTDLGVHTGSKIVISYKPTIRNNGMIEIKKSPTLGLEQFFGMGARQGEEEVEDVDALIAQAVLENDQY